MQEKKFTCPPNVCPQATIFGRGPARIASYSTTASPLLVAAIGGAAACTGAALAGVTGPAFATTYVTTHNFFKFNVNYSQTLLTYLQLFQPGGDPFQALQQRIHFYINLAK